MFCFFSQTIYLAFTFQRSPKSVNRMICYSYMTYSIAKANRIFFKVKIFRPLVMPLIIVLYSRISIFIKYCILVYQIFPSSKISGYVPLMKWSEQFWSREYDGWEMLYNRKMILIKIAQKKGNKKAENKQWKKSGKIRVRKNQGKMKAKWKMYQRHLPR